MEYSDKINTKRIIWLDALRVFSAFSIVWLHISSYFTENLLPYGSFSWWCTDVYLAFCRYAVPVFVMISGAFFLNPQKRITVSNIYGKYILRMLCVLFGWAAVHTAVVYAWLAHTPAGGLAGAFFWSVKTYWFLPMIIGLYMIAPVLRAMTELNRKALLQYFMVLSVVLGMLVPMLAELFPKQLGPFLGDFVKVLKLPCLYFGAHFVFGYYVCAYGVGTRARKWFYAGGALGVLAMAAGAYAAWGEPASRLYYYSMHGASLSPVTFLTGAAVFLAVKERLEKARLSARAAFYVQRLAYYSLGVYMLHIILVEAAGRLGWFKAVDFMAPVTVPALAVLLFLFSSGVIGALYKIPWLRKCFL